jgi:mannose-1-phosphate guanylyltransferase
MKAAILAAGLGTRLQPLTDVCPKALIPVLNRPLLGLWLARLEAAGFVQVALNTHHLAGMVHDFLTRRGPWGLNLQLNQEPEILGTGGGLRDLGKILGQGPFLAVNVDVLSDLDLAAIWEHRRAGALSTLVLHDCPPFNNVWVSGGEVVGIGGPPPAGARLLAYTGVQVVEEAMLNYLPGQGHYDLVAAWREALAAGERLAALVVTGHFWQDLGTPASYLETHRRLFKGEAAGLAPFFPGVKDPLIGPGATVGPGANFGGNVCLGAQVQVGAGASLENTIVWEWASIAPQVRLKDCLVAAGAKVNHSAQGQILI